MVKLTVKVLKIFEWEEHFGYAAQTKRRYIMKDPDGKIYVWKTTCCLGRWDNETQTGYSVIAGDTVVISGTIKGESEYKGQPQTELARVKLVEVLEHALTKEERIALKKKEQLASIKDGDFIWEMPYRQYKAHYADCETLAGSFNNHLDPWNRQVEPATICVIIREGRLKPSGVRGQHFHGFVMQNELGKRSSFRAVSEENAVKQANKEFPGHAWTCVKIYDYAN